MTPTEPILKKIDELLEAIAREAGSPPDDRIENICSFAIKCVSEHPGNRIMAACVPHTNAVGGGK